MFRRSTIHPLADPFAPAPIGSRSEPALDSFGAEHDFSAGATTLARKVLRRAPGSRGRIDVAAISGAGSYRYRLVRGWSSAEQMLGWGVLNSPNARGGR